MSQLFRQSLPEKGGDIGGVLRNLLSNAIIRSGI